MKHRFSSKTAYLIFTLLFTVPVFVAMKSTDSNALKAVFLSDYYRRIMLFTVFQAFISSFLSFLIGLPGAFILSETDFRGKQLLKTIYNIPFILPSIITVLAFTVFYGNNGFLNKFLMKIFSLTEPPLKILYSFKAVIIAHVFYNAPLFSVLLSDSIHSVDGNSVDAARCDGAETKTIRKKIFIPLIKNSVYSSFCLVFLYCFTSFAIIMVLGGNLGMTTAEVEIYRLAKISFDLPKACALSFFSITVAMSVLTVHSLLQKKSSVKQNNLKHPPLRKATVAEKAYAIVSVLFITLPLLGILIKSLTASATRTSDIVFSLKPYLNFDWSTLIRTSIIALFSSVLGTIIAYIFSLDIENTGSVLKNTYLMLPMAVSSVILGLSYFVIMNKLKFIPQTVILILAHTVLVIPFSLRTILPAVQNLPQTYFNEAKLEGVKDFKCLKQIIIPLTSNSMITALSYGFAISCGELNSTILIASGNYLTIPLLINRQISSYNYQSACAYAVVLTAVCFVLFYISNSFKERHNDSF